MQIEYYYELDKGYGRFMASCDQDAVERIKQKGLWDKLIILYREECDSDKFEIIWKKQMSNEVNFTNISLFQQWYDKAFPEGITNKRGVCRSGPMTLCETDVQKVMQIAFNNGVVIGQGQMLRAIAKANGEKEGKESN